MTTHVFIVNEDTFGIHLKYMFAGTGKGDGEENIGMISDLSGCRIDDKVIFYVEGVGFFGVFKVDSAPFWEKKGEYLTKDIKKLTNRVLIKPLKVYPLGVPEWEALDNLDNLPNGKDSPANNLIWSLIYRKLEGGRGCTPIFDYEYKQLFNLIKGLNKKCGKDHLNNVYNYNYDFDKKEIKEFNDKKLFYDKSRIKFYGIPLLDKLNNKKINVEKKIVQVKNREFKYKGKYRNKFITKTQAKCEAELEYFFVKNIGFDVRVDNIIGEKDNLIFWGSQIFCGVGKRRIDLLSITKSNVIRLIELKDEEFQEYQLDQIIKYVRWVEQYIREPKEKKIQPILIINNKRNIDKGLIKKYNSQFEKHLSENLMIYTWNIDKSKIRFEEFDYNENQ